MTRYYVPEWVTCPHCGEPVRITKDNIIFRHKRFKDHPILNDYWFRASVYMEPCEGSRQPYSLIPKEGDR